MREQHPDRQTELMILYLQNLFVTISIHYNIPQINDVRMCIMCNNCFHRDRWPFTGFIFSLLMIKQVSEKAITYHKVSYFLFWFQKSVFFIIASLDCIFLVVAYVVDRAGQDRAGRGGAGIALFSLRHGIIRIAEMQHTTVKTNVIWGDKVRPL